MYDQNFINEEVMMHRRVLINLAQLLGIDTADLAQREDQLTGAVMRRMRSHFADPAGRPAPTTRAAQHLSVPLSISLVGIDHYVWSLQALLHKQWDLVALDGIKAGLNEEEEEEARKEALASVDYADSDQLAAVRDRAEHVLINYVNSLVFNLVTDADLTADDKRLETDEPVEGPFGAYHHAAARLAKKYFSVLVLPEASDAPGSYHEQWAGLARDPQLADDRRLSLSIVPRRLESVLCDPTQYTLTTNGSSARATGSSGAPDTCEFKPVGTNEFGLGHSPLDAMVHYLATSWSISAEERVFWERVRTKLR